MAKPETPSSPPASTLSASFLREVDEALQYERILALWHLYRWAIIGGVMLILLAVAASQGWQAWRQHQARTLATQWYAISSISADDARAARMQEFMKNATGGYKALAAFSLAASGTQPAAEKVKAYEVVANDSSQPEWLRQLAGLNIALALLGADDARAKAELEKITRAGAASPLYPAALEQLAIMAQRQGDAAAARGYTRQVLEAAMVPPDMKARSQQRLGQLSTLAR